MAAPIDFYFDFSSPYGYLASRRIDALASAHGRKVTWRPILLGVAFKATGGAPLPSIPIKGVYAMRDFLRSARFHGIPYHQPTTFPVSTISAVRAFYWLQDRDPAKAVELAKALYNAYFVDGVDISKPENVAQIAGKLGVKAEDLAAALNDQAVKDRTKKEVDAAVAHGVFGSPYVIVDGEPFWGMDRLDQVERWLAKGPF
ncbi:MAG TPA: 2-hydroxychromene-2-carboxylate isomerase [Burkholderiales bacterium]|jgi:2-hydroxychromene-2-carboxylate isomerase|nr:2-hydroxychromene-2-carboxylate isomerase [Burkholderiales bacterium]